MQSYHSIGLMSGTSLDGLDIILCKFSFNKNWNFKIIKCHTIEYSKEWYAKLYSAPTLSGFELSLLHKEYGSYIGDCVKKFLKDISIDIDLIASHGHTVFHQPDKKLTLQIGDGQEIAIKTGIKTISDFRSLDVAMGGQGAPLVPIGDKLLFSDYDYCINIGGFANVSFEESEIRYAYDICPANIILNYLANKLGQPYDKNGALGLLGKINHNLLEKLNSLKYYSQSHPKSLGKEWLDNTFLPVIKDTKITFHDQLRTVYEHIALQISRAINSDQNSKTLLTGGGTYNKLLINLIKHNNSSEIIIPDKKIIEYKEALIFALLGTLKLKNQVNTLASVTGASKNSSSGILYNP